MKFLTAGESHGPGLTAILDGLPSNFTINETEIKKVMKLRRTGYGRGRRMTFEDDEVIITGGLIRGKTYGAPISFFIRNKDSGNFQEKMTIPRPGHSDFSGSLKYELDNLSYPAECQGGRKTAATVVLGEISRQFLSVFNIEILGYVYAIGTESSIPEKTTSIRLLRETAEASPLRLACRTNERNIIKLIDQAAKQGDTLGGKIQIVAENLPIGLGAFSQWDRRLDSRLAAGVMSVPGIKAVSIGAGFKSSEIPGSKFQDSIFAGGIRTSNNSGGIEGGISNGERLEMTAAMKPIPSLKKSLPSLDLSSGKEGKAAYIRSDVIAVPAAAMTCEAMTAIILLEFFIERFGKDTLEDTKINFDTINNKIKERIKA